MIWRLQNKKTFIFKIHKWLFLNIYTLYSNQYINFICVYCFLYSIKFSYLWWQFSPIYCWAVKTDYKLCLLSNVNIQYLRIMLSWNLSKQCNINMIIFLSNRFRSFCNIDCVILEIYCGTINTYKWKQTNNHSNAQPHDNHFLVSPVVNASISFLTHCMYKIQTHIFL